MKFLIALSLVFVFACGGRDAASTGSSSTSAAETTATQSTTTQADTTLTPAPAPVGVEPVAGPKLSPVDEAAKDPTFVAYREKLRAALQAHDTKAVLALVDPKIRTSFGDGGGVTAFEKILARPGAFELLNTTLSLGGTFLGGSNDQAFWAPYVYSAWPEEKDAFSHLAVIAENVPLRKSADANAEVIATLSYDIVEGTPTEEPWKQVKTTDGRTGFVEWKNVWSPIGYRAGFNKQNGEWKMTGFVAGD